MGGGLPRGRVIAVLGGAGSGKTIFALQTLASGAALGERGLFVAFEEGPEDLVANAARFTWSDALRGAGVEFVDARLSQSILHGGEFDLLGLCAVLGARAKERGARRIALDGLDQLLTHLGDAALVRREVTRLREWIHETGLTAVITAKTEGADGRLAPDQGALQYLSDCVIALDHRVQSGTALRSLRVVKYRGGEHSANELPFTITRAGIEVSSSSSAELDVPAPSERVSSGVERLDTMLQGGYFRGSTTLISGAPGTAKTTLAAAFAAASCARGEPTLYVSFDEAPGQIVRNVASVGIDFAPHVAAGALRLCGLRTRAADAESQVTRVRALMREHGARSLVLDPLSALMQTGSGAATEFIALHLLDLARASGITTVATSLIASSQPLSEETPLGVSTLADTWMHLSYVAQGGERNRALTIIKSRGTDHSNQVRELVLTSAGVTLADVYTAGGEVLMGTLRWERESEERRERESARRLAELKAREAELAVAETRARVEVLLREQAVREAELERLRAERRDDAERSTSDDAGLRSRRRADAGARTEGSSGAG